MGRAAQQMRLGLALVDIVRYHDGRPLDRKRFAYYLNRALVMFIGASALRAVASVLELVLPSAAWG